MKLVSSIPFVHDFGVTGGNLSFWALEVDPKLNYLHHQKCVDITSPVDNSLVIEKVNLTFKFNKELRHLNLMYSNLEFETFH